MFASVIRRVLSAEFEFRLPAIFLQPLVPNPKTSSDFFPATIPSFPLEIWINNKTVGLVTATKLPLV